ncbi:FkbM family methyltransferase [Patescibacteria group bacterium]
MILKSVFLPIPRPPFSKKINGVIFSFDFKDSSQLEKNMYRGIYEMGVIGMLKTSLKNGDTFIDVGANIGYITTVGASLVGKKGWVYSFEPVPEYFSKLRNLVKLNNEYNIVANQIALSDRAGEEKIYVSDHSNIGANTILPGLIDSRKIRDTVFVQTYRLDEYIENKNIKNIKVIKIDTEGFEYPILLGLKGFLNKCCVKKLLVPPLIICEITPQAYKLLGYKLDDIFKYMKQFNYYPFSILNSKKELNIKKIEEELYLTKNILFKVKK